MAFDINARFLACVASEMITFLDFDGVLHPSGPRSDWPEEEASPFSLLPRLLGVLDDFPAVEVVVFSNCTPHPDAEVPKPLRRRIVGRTPEVKKSESAVRYREILKYLELTRQSGRPWIALDTDARHYPQSCSGLILCPCGFRETEERQMRNLLTTRLV